MLLHMKGKQEVVETFLELREVDGKVKKYEYE